MSVKTNRNFGVLSLFVVYLVALLSSPDALAAPPINTLEKSGLFKYRHGDKAIRGYDTVAYFTQGKAIKGTSAYSSNWNGAIWHFSSAEHQALFDQEPERFAPQFGGYCAYGIAGGYLAKIEGGQWSIVDEKLYLSYSQKFRTRWLKEPERYIEQAAERFEQLLIE